jgi:predicted AlkP superfamily phosphohydrolase/phosphomutase
VNNLKPDSSDQVATEATSNKPLSHDTAIDVDVEAARENHETRSQRVGQDAEVEQAREVGANEITNPWVSSGGGDRTQRLLLIGLDGATPELALGAWRTELRTLHMLTERGARGRLRSSLPWTSTPAWLSLLSGQDPGQLGVYGRRRRVNHSYTGPIAPDSRAVAEPRLWDILGRAGKHVGIVGAPATTPPPQIHGHLISDQPVDGAPATYPGALHQQVALWLEDMPALRPASTDDSLDLLVGNAYVRSEQRFRLARGLLARDTYDCFAVFDDGIATVQRALWDSLDITHQRYTPDHPFAGTISSFYRFVDDQIADLLEMLDQDTVVVVVSACGAQALDGELALNNWLLEQGELALHTIPSEPTPLDRCAVDWEHTRAWAADDGAIYLNIAGREPHGTIPAALADQVSASLAERLRALAAPDSRPAGPIAEHQGGAPAVEVYRPAALYAATRGIAPELLAVCRQPGWRPTATLGQGATWISTREIPMDAAWESPAGFIVVYDPRNLGGGRELDEATIYDVLPTLLALFDLPTVARLRGHALLGL